MNKTNENTPEGNLGSYRELDVSDTSLLKTPRDEKDTIENNVRSTRPSIQQSKPENLSTFQISSVKSPGGSSKRDLKGIVFQPIKTSDRNNSNIELGKTVKSPLAAKKISIDTKREDKEGKLGISGNRMTEYPLTTDITPLKKIDNNDEGVKETKGPKLSRETEKTKEDEAKMLSLYKFHLLSENNKEELEFYRELLEE